MTVTWDCYVHDVTDAEDRLSSDPTSDFKLETSTGLTITDVSHLKTALQKEDVVIRLSNKSRLRWDTVSKSTANLED